MIKINKDTKLYGSFSETPGNNGCNFFNDAFEKYGIDAIYKSFYSKDIKKSIEAARTLNMAGFAISAPFKILTFDYVNEITPNVGYIGSINTVKNIGFNGQTFFKGFNTDWIGAKKILEPLNLDHLYILGDGGFSKAVQFACTIMKVKFEVITRETWSKLETIQDSYIFNATPIKLELDTSISFSNNIIDGRPHTKSGKAIALEQAKAQFKIYTGVDYDA